jgi:NAD(P)-dependent dehydrogenase (short-subunit alcohol dehydrogenase family)
MRAAISRKDASVSTDHTTKTLTGKVALVTGGARRVGRAIAMELGLAGASVAIHYRASDKDADAVAADLALEGAYARSFAADLADGAACKNLVEAVVGWKGRLDIVVNNAAVFPRVPFLGGDDTAWESAWAEALDVNVLAPARIVRAAAPALAASGTGVVVNMIDIAAQQAWPAYTAYGSSKAALAWLTRTLAVALAPKVRVCGIAPGIAEFPDDMSAEIRERLVAKVPLARAGSPEAIARAVRFLVEHDYITGTILPVDGGRLAATGENA